MSQIIDSWILYERLNIFLLNIPIFFGDEWSLGNPSWVPRRNSIDYLDIPMKGIRICYYVGILSKDICLEYENVLRMSGGHNHNRKTKLLPSPMI